MRLIAPRFPSTRFIGVDIDPPIVGPLGRGLSETCSFEKANIEEEWTFAGENSVDFILARMLATGVRD